MEIKRDRVNRTIKIT